MRGGCEPMLADWGEDLEALLMTRETHDFNTIVTQFCGDGSKDESITRSCYGLEPSDGLPNNDKYNKYPYHFTQELEALRPRQDEGEF